MLVYIVVAWVVGSVPIGLVLAQLLARASAHYPENAKH